MRKLHFRHIFALIINSNSIKGGIFVLLIFLTTDYFMSNDNDFKSNKTKLVETTIDYKYKSTISQGERAVWIYLYRYQVNSIHYEGKSYGNLTGIKTGDKVSVIYNVSNPKLSKLVGYRDKILTRHLPTLLILLAFGLLHFINGLFLLSKRIRFIRNGTVIRAFYDNHFSLLGNEKTKSGNIFRLTLRYSILSFNDIKKNFYFASIKYLHNKFDYKLLVDTNNPKRAIIINNFPKTVLKLIEEQ